VRPLRSIDSERLREDRDLFERFRDPDRPIDREILVERFLPLARSLAARYVRRGEPYDDVFQVACIGLVQAIDRYDPARGIAFSSYAVPTIAGEIKRYYRDKTWTIHVPRDLRELVLTVDRAVTELERDLGRTPSVDDIAARVGATDEDVLEALHAGHARRPASLDAPASADPDSPPASRESIGMDEAGFERVEQRAALDHLTAILTPRERRVIVLRFEHELTQAEIAQHVGVSQMQVSRILSRILGDLRNHLAAPGAG